MNITNVYITELNSIFLLFLLKKKLSWNFIRVLVSKTLFIRLPRVIPYLVKCRGIYRRSLHSRAFWAALARRDPIIDLVGGRSIIRPKRGHWFFKCRWQQQSSWEEEKAIHCLSCYVLVCTIITWEPPPSSCSAVFARPTPPTPPSSLQKIPSVGFTFPIKTVLLDHVAMQKEGEIKRALDESLEDEKGFLHRRADILSVVRSAEVLEGFHASVSTRTKICVEAPEKCLAPNVGSETVPFVALLAKRATEEVGTLVMELQHVKGDNREVHKAKKTLPAELAKAKTKIEGLKKDNQLLEDSYAQQTRLIWRMRAVHCLYKETMERMPGVKSSHQSSSTHL
uniref:Uncharacterized protein n=1 Tax=Cannabis sativa TaxID=3483 RepID=A0A803NJ52_CANSA